MSEWKPIETAPRDSNIIAKFWHGVRYYVLEAKPCYRVGWVDVDPDSCVGWMPTAKKPGFWLCKAPPRTENAP